MSIELTKEITMHVVPRKYLFKYEYYEIISIKTLTQQSPVIPICRSYNVFMKWEFVEFIKFIVKNVPVIHLC